MKTFEAQLEAIFEKQLGAAEAVAKNAIQGVMQTCQTPKSEGGRMPVKTSTLRNSVASGLNGSFGAPGPESYLLTVSGLKLGDVARFAWTVKYAHRRNSGFTGTDSLGRTYADVGDRFVEAGASQWQRLVREQAARVTG